MVTARLRSEVPWLPYWTPDVRVVNAYLQTVAPPPWYIPDGITSGDVVAVYVPKGAASFATSLSNVANPGTRNALDTSYTDTSWSSAGWGFAVNSTEYLSAGYTPTELGTNPTVIIGISGNTSSAFQTGYIYGATGTNAFALQVRASLLIGYSGSYSTEYIATMPSSGVIAITRAAVYLNGVAKASFTTHTSPVSSTDHKIGSLGSSTLKAGTYTIAWVAAYSTRLTPEQIAAVGDAAP